MRRKKQKHKTTYILTLFQQRKKTRRRMNMLECAISCSSSSSSPSFIDTSRNELQKSSSGHSISIQLRHRLNSVCIFFSNWNELVAAHKKCRFSLAHSLPLYLSLSILLLDCATHSHRLRIWWFGLIAVMRSWLWSLHRFCFQPEFQCIRTRIAVVSLASACQMD